ncbi:MAG TPA: glycosyltransferase, partial [Chloroflexota bacterium]|nr:glycosyltransferase [Chloroflexota bacterium]
MRLTVVYHRAFWESDGGYWEREGAFSRFVEALAARVDVVELVVPLTAKEVAGGHRLQADNVKLRALPDWLDLIEFYRRLPSMLVTLWLAAAGWQTVVIRVPTPLGFWAWLVARLRGVPTVLILVGDLAEVAETVTGSSWKRRLYRIWARIEDLLMRAMARSTLTFANGEALWT